MRTSEEWYILAEYHWYIVGEYAWYIVGEYGWRSVGEYHWYIIGRSVTICRTSGCLKSPSPRERMRT